MQASDNVLLLQAKSDSDKLALHFFFRCTSGPTANGYLRHREQRALTQSCT